MTFTNMSLTYFPQMDGYETLFADDFYYVCLLCWFPIMVEWYAKNLATEKIVLLHPKEPFFFVSTKNYLEMIFSDEVNYVWHTPNSHKIKQHLRNFLNARQQRALFGNLGIQICKSC